VRFDAETKALAIGRFHRIRESSAAGDDLDQVDQLGRRR
jgi:hypothetical protein